MSKLRAFAFSVSLFCGFASLLFISDGDTTLMLVSSIMSSMNLWHGLCWEKEKDSE